jgi:outer membrane lipoprotein-sorting protein
MPMKSRSLLLLLLALTTAVAAHAQTVDEVLAKHYETMGGLDRIRSLKSIRMTGAMALAPGMEAPLMLEMARPNRSRLEFSVMGMSVVRAFDGQKSWSVMPMMGKAEPAYDSDAESSQASAEADLDGPLVGWRERGDTITLVGKEKVDGVDAFHLKVTRKSGAVSHHWLDAETFLELRVERKGVMRGEEVESQTTFSDYREVNGYLVAFNRTMGAKGSDRRMTMVFTDVVVNVPIDDARFTLPGAPPAKSDSKPDGGH